MSTWVANIDLLDPLRRHQENLNHSIPSRFEKNGIGFLRFIHFSVFMLCASLVGFSVLPFSKAIVLFALMIGMGGAIMLPLEYALFNYFFYLLFDGFFKLASGYNPVVHVGQDLVLLVVLWRSLIHIQSGGIAKLSQLPHVAIISIFSIWVFLQYLNPFGLGLLPSLSGSKIYFAPIAVYFLSYFHLDERSRKNIIYWLVGLATFEGIFATVEYLFFPELLYQLGETGSISYGTVSKSVFEGALYRPMGTGALPGAPSVWISLVSPFATYLLIKPGEVLKARLLALSFFIFAIPTLIFSQVRVSIVLTLLSIIAVSIFPNTNWKKHLAVVSLALVCTITLVVFYMNKTLSNLNINENALKAATGSFENEDSGVEEGLISDKKMSVLQKRIFTLGTTHAYTSSRGSPTPLVIQLAKQMPFGIGLSRTSAGSSPWIAEIEKNPYFGRNWAFTDNLLLALFTELGIFGTLMWFIMVGTLIHKLFKKSVFQLAPDCGFLVWVCFVGSLVILIAGLDTEGILYSPVAPFFWLMIGIGMREAMYVK